MPTNTSQPDMNVSDLNIVNCYEGGEPEDRDIRYISYKEGDKIRIVKQEYIRSINEWCNKSQFKCPPGALKTLANEL